MKFCLLKLIFSVVIFLGICEIAIAQVTGVVNSSATQAQNQNNKAGSNNIMLGQSLIATGTATFQTYLVFMGVMALKQGQTQKERAQQAGRTAYDSSYKAAQFTAYVNKEAEDALAAATKYLEGRGYKFDPKKLSVTNPDGAAFNLSDLSRNAADMAKKTGLSEEDIEKALAAMDGKAKEISKDMKVAKVEMTGGTGGNAPAPGTGITGFDFSRNNASRKPMNVEIAGLKKYLGNDQIGVAGDDIFSMVQRRYREKNKEEFFSK